YAWVSHEDPRGLYAVVNEIGRERNWGLPPVDYDPRPVPGFEPFLQILLAEMLAVVESSPGDNSVGREDPGEESPFEDVSAERVMRVLLDNFQAREFRTTCPFVQPAEHIPH